MPSRLSTGEWPLVTRGEGLGEDGEADARPLTGLPGVDADGEERLERLDWLRRSLLSVNRLCFFRLAASFTTERQEHGKRKRFRFTVTRSVLALIGILFFVRI